MKLLLIICLSLLSTDTLLAQNNGHYSFNFKFTNLSDDQIVSQKIDVYSSNNFFVVNSAEEYVSESVAVDQSQKKVLELMDYKEDDNQVIRVYNSFDYSDSISDVSNFSDIFNHVLGIHFRDAEMEFLSETKLICGLTCQKFVMKKPELNEPGGMIIAEGWFVPNVHCSIDGRQHFLDSRMGMVLEAKVIYSYDMFEVNCLSYDPDFPESSTVYSTYPPIEYVKVNQD